MLVIPTKTYYKKVPVMVGSKIIDRAMGMMTKGELARATVTWRQTHFAAIMSGSLQLPCTTSKEDREVGKEVTPSQSSDPAASRGFGLNDVQGPVHTTQKLPFPHLGLLASTATQVSGDAAWGSTCLPNQHMAPNCLPL